jgi:tripartite-type tricarboxylate transporter receptor subunit TctC
MLTKRTFLTAAGASLLAQPAMAQNFTKTVKIVVPFAPGGTSDILARLIQPKLQEALGQAVIVENKVGAGGNIGADSVAKADKDGHTLLLIDVASLAILPALKINPPYSPTKDLTPIGMVLFAPYILAVTPSVPAKTVPELITYLKVNPGKIAFSNPGIGGGNHIAGLQLAKSWGVEVIDVPYKGGADATRGVVAGEAQILLNGATATLPFVTSGQLRGLAVSGDIRLDQAKDVPSFKELNLAASDSGTWQGLLTTAGSPAELVNRLNLELNKILNMPDIATKIIELGGQQKQGKPADMAKWLEKATNDYAATLKDIGMKPLP